MADRFSSDRNKVQRQGIEVLTPSEVQIIKKMNTGSFMPRSAQFIDPRVDLIWGKDSGLRPAAKSYFDYYFSGQDLQLYIDGIDKDDPDSDIPIMDFAFNIQQVKTPVYGFWSYTYDAVMHGTRIVNGQFRIATRTTDYMYRVISKAAQARVDRASSGHTAAPDQDQLNVEKYWYQFNEKVKDRKNIFSNHPAFNFLLVCGVQTPSLPNPDARAQNILNTYKSDKMPLFNDVNERLVDSAPDEHAMRYVIESIELTNMQVEVTPDGTVCSEVYSFFGRDMYIPNV